MRETETFITIYFQRVIKKLFCSKNILRVVCKKRNEYMVDNSDYVIAVWNGKPSGTGNTVKYARKNNKMVLLVDPQTLEIEKC